MINEILPRLYPRAVQEDQMESRPLPHAFAVSSLRV